MAYEVYENGGDVDTAAVSDQYEAADNSGAVTAQRRQEIAEQYASWAENQAAGLSSSEYGI